MISIPELEDGEGAWSRADAMELIAALKGSPVVVSRVVVFNQAPWGYVPSELALSTDRLPNEPEVDYAARSRTVAADFVRNWQGDESNTLFALTFPLWRDAA